MRHQKKKITLGRKTAARRSLLANLVESLVLYEKITTTTGKAKALRPLAERLITKAKQNNLAARRYLGTFLYTAKVIKKMMEVIGPRYADRQGGYTRITKIGVRRGDGGEQSVIELV
ncbi:MAG: 50S ribosomal protein L17 [Candidatus Magasanikbacteria bacterium RIFOXYC2_FULL_42_28]|uniref:Large ribosomal subunit protein bL17 n=1 Tax=Candidatus Magasanikbacteria bacterium RIFOXYC2_FULL_42_28 TaxID=1798704 RepID=A0A1F6NY07_9BACT|nr:MAG: 50S ribosomal protein L17 [Candidatus Magasanikbacteria bacterium RIFOXYC2_FULL_42_28]